MNEAIHQHSKHVSVPAGEGVRVDTAVTIEKPLAEVYRFWRRLENLPRFMNHLKSVTVQDDLHSHWVARTAGGKTLEWDSEIIEQRENQMISWRSAPGADVDNAGSVWFTELPSGVGTLLRVEMKYVPPGGKAGALIASALGEDAESEIREDLKRLKVLMETGRLPRKQETRPLKWATKAAETVSDLAGSYAQNNPWRFVGAAAAVGLALGFIIGFTSASRRKYDAAPA